MDEKNTATEETVVDEEMKTEEKPAKKAKSGKKEEIERLKTELALAQAEAEDCKRKWYNVAAEYENYRRRTQTQSAQRYAEGRNDVIGALFPVGDNLSRAIAVCTDENTKHGMEMVLKSFKKVLEDEGIEEIDPIGQPFDPVQAEASMAMPAADGEEAGIVKMVHEKGYKKGDKILRYAKVVVTQ